MQIQVKMIKEWSIKEYQTITVHKIWTDILTAESIVISICPNLFKMSRIFMQIFYTEQNHNKNFIIPLIVIQFTCHKNNTNTYIQVSLEL